jgi:hypothetical protein
MSTMFSMPVTQSNVEQYFVGTVKENNESVTKDSQSNDR